MKQLILSQVLPQLSGITETFSSDLIGLLGSGSASTLKGFTASFLDLAFLIAPFWTLVFESFFLADFAGAFFAFFGLETRTMSFVLVSILTCAFLGTGCSFPRLSLVLSLSAANCWKSFSTVKFDRRTRLLCTFFSESIWVVDSAQTLVRKHVILLMEACR